MTHATNIQQLAEALVGHAERLGVVLTITAQPQQPLAMGHVKMVAEAREARHADELAQPAFDPIPTILPCFTGVAMRKLKELLAGGHAIDGVAFSKPDGEHMRRGFITTGGLVGWWRGNSTIDWSQVGKLIDAAHSAEVRQHIVGTSNWAAAVCRAMGAEPAQPEALKPGESEQDEITAMVDAAMIEMKNIYPPLRRSECQRLISAAIHVAAPPAQTPHMEEQPDGSFIPVDTSEMAAPPAQTPPPPAHPDDAAVDRFAAAMKAKMAASRAKGRGGWDDRNACTEASLQAMLVDHVAKGDPVDVGNFAMMLFNRGERATLDITNSKQSQQALVNEVKRLFCDAKVSPPAQTPPPRLTNDKLREVERFMVYGNWPILKFARAIESATRAACGWPDMPEATQPPAPAAKRKSTACTECAWSDSWGMPDIQDALVCRSCSSGSNWAPLNEGSVNPNKPRYTPTDEGIGND